MVEEGKEQDGKEQDGKGLDAKIIRNQKRIYIKCRIYKNV